MSSYPTKKCTTSRGFIYNYIHITPSTPNTEYLLFLHGFPSSAHDYHYQIDFFKERGYGIIVPDLLGYGGTSKPLDVESYAGKGMTQDISEILKGEGIEKVVGVGHDWGSFPLSRLANYYPHLLSKLIFLDVGYQAPGNSLNEQTINFMNGMVQEKFGYSVFGYFLFFNEDDAAGLLDANVESALSLFHSKDEESVKKNMGAVGGMRKWLNEGKVAEDEGYLSSEDKEYNRDFFAPEKGGFGPALNWYRAQVQDINAADEQALPKESAIIHQPVLLITSDNFITASADFPNQMKAFAKDFTVENLHTGHWVMLEKPRETSELLERFIKR